MILMHNQSYVDEYLLCLENYILKFKIKKDKTVLI